MSDPFLLPLAQASNDVYDPALPPTWKMFTNRVQCIHAYKMVAAGYVTYAFEGTHNLEDWLVDLAAIETPIVDHPRIGAVHLAFWRNVQSIIEAIKQDLAGLGWPPYLVTGHSKGADEALMLHAAMLDFGRPPLATRAFEPAHPGSAGFGAFLAGQDIRFTRTKNAGGFDIVTCVPPGPTWAHVGGCLELTVPDNLSIVEKHSMTNVLAALPPPAIAAA